mgnify:CR=1 FL=1
MAGRTPSSSPTLGCRATCVDNDVKALALMRDAYPDDWNFIVGDAFEFPKTTRKMWDLVTVDVYTSDFDRAAQMTQEWCDMARRAVVLGTGCGHRGGGAGRVADPGAGGAFGVHGRRVLDGAGAHVTFDDVTACLVTRGDVDLTPILETLPYRNVIVWGPEREELHVYGRYMAIAGGDHPGGVHPRTTTASSAITASCSAALRAGADRQHVRARRQPRRVRGHGADPRRSPHGRPSAALGVQRVPRLLAAGRGVLAGGGHDQRHHHPARACRICRSRSGWTSPRGRTGCANQPWQRDLKLEITNRARQVRDRLWAVA